MNECYVIGHDSPLTSLGWQVVAGEESSTMSTGSGGYSLSVVGSHGVLRQSLLLLALLATSRHVTMTSLMTSLMTSCHDVTDDVMTGVRCYCWLYSPSVLPSLPRHQTVLVDDFLSLVLSSSFLLSSV